MVFVKWKRRESSYLILSMQSSLRKYIPLKWFFLQWWFSEVFYTFTSVGASSLETLNIKQSFVRTMLSRAFQWSKTAKCIRTKKKYGKPVQ